MFCFLKQMTISDTSQMIFLAINRSLCLNCWLKDKHQNQKKAKMERNLYFLSLKQVQTQKILQIPNQVEAKLPFWQKKTVSIYFCIKTCPCPK